MEIKLDRELLLRPRAFDERELELELKKRSVGNAGNFYDWTICVWNLNSVSRLSADPNAINPRAYNSGIVTAMDAEYVDSMSFDRSLINKFLEATFEGGHKKPDHVIRISSPVAKLPTYVEKVVEVGNVLERRGMGVMYWPSFGDFSPGVWKGKMNNWTTGAHDYMPPKLRRIIAPIEPVDL